MPKPESELLVINKMYDLVIWGCRRIAKFPRDRRYTLGDRLEGRLCAVLEELIEARYTTDRGKRGVRLTEFNFGRAMSFHTVDARFGQN